MRKRRCGAVWREYEGWRSGDHFVALKKVVKVSLTKKGLSKYKEEVSHPIHAEEHRNEART